MKTLFTKSSFLMFFILVGSIGYAQQPAIVPQNGPLKKIPKPLVPRKNRLPKDFTWTIDKNVKKEKVPPKISFTSIKDGQFIFISSSSNQNSSSSSEVTGSSAYQNNDSSGCFAKGSKSSGELCVYNTCEKKEVCARSVIGSIEPPRGCSTGGHCKDLWNPLNKVKWAFLRIDQPYSEIQIRNAKGEVVAKSKNKKYVIDGISGYVAYPVEIINNIYGVANIKVGSLNKVLYVRPR